MRPPVALEGTIRNLLELAERTQLTQARDALMLAQSAAQIAGAASTKTLEFEAERMGARLAYALGEMDCAEQHFRRASAAARALKDSLSVARIEASLAFLAYDRGDTSDAHQRLDGVDDTLAQLREEQGSGKLTALVAGYRGNLARQVGAYDDARAHYQNALACARRHDAAVPAATFAMDLGAAELAAGASPEAARWLARADRETRALGPGSARSLLMPLVDHYQALHAMASGSRDPALVELDGPAVLLSIRKWLFDARGPSLDADMRRRLVRLRQDAGHYEHARFGVNLLERFLLVSVPEARVVVSRDGSWITNGVLDHRHRTGMADLAHREPLRRILEGLVRATEAETALSRDALVRLGWPGERMHPAAAKNRVHVALSTLRSLGLGPALLRNEAGYLLDPAAVKFV